jgi:hypothetical protein
LAGKIYRYQITTDSDSGVVEFYANGMFLQTPDSDLPFYGYYSYTKQGYSQGLVVLYVWGPSGWIITYSAILYTAPDQGTQSQWVYDPSTGRWATRTGSFQPGTAPVSYAPDALAGRTVKVRDTGETAWNTAYFAANTESTTKADGSTSWGYYSYTKKSLTRGVISVSTNQSGAWYYDYIIVTFTSANGGTWEDWYWPADGSAAAEHSTGEFQLP